MYCVLKKTNLTILVSKNVHVTYSNESRDEHVHLTFY